MIRYRGDVSDSVRWRGFPFRPDDIVISTPPKCGTTWMQMICALLVLQRPDLGAPLSTLSPWLDMLSRARSEVVADLEAQRHRRFIKTHTPLDGLPVAPGVTYICVARDPRDVALSMDAHRDNMDMDRFVEARDRAARVDGFDVSDVPPSPSRAATERERFWQWVDDDTPPAERGSSLRRTLWHLGTFWDRRAEPGIVLLHYDELQAELDGQMRRLAARLGIEVPGDRWPELVAAARFEAMRSHAATVAPTTRGQSFWRDDKEFFRSGTSGQWRQLLDEGDLARYRRRVAGLASPELVAWAHGGTAP